MALVLGVAFGPRATHVEVRDADTGVLAASGHARHVDLGPDVDVEDPTAWWRSLVAAVAQAGEREIAAISVCGGHPGLVLLDGAGAVLRPVQPWAEAHAERDAAHLRSVLGAERWARRAGMLPMPASPITRLAWLRRTDPESYARIGAVLLPHDWLTYRLAGRAVTDRGGASLTGAWSPHDGAWIPEVLEELAPAGRAGEWARRLPTVLGPADRADWLTAPVYELLGLRGRPIVGPGTGEAMAVALALGLRTGPRRRLAGRQHHGAGRGRSPARGCHRCRAEPGRCHGPPPRPHHARRGVRPSSRSWPTCSAWTDESLAGLAVARGPGAGGLVLVPGVPGRAGAVLTGLRTGAGPRRAGRAAFDGVASRGPGRRRPGSWTRAPRGRPASRSDSPAPSAAFDAHAQILATLADRVVVPAPPVSLAAAGACVQAAAVLAQAPPRTCPQRGTSAPVPRVDPRTTRPRWLAASHTPTSGPGSAAPCSTPDPCGCPHDGLRTNEMV